MMIELFHGTSAKAWAHIQRRGLCGRVYLGSRRVATYFAEEAAEDDDSSEVLLAVRVPTAPLEPDWPGLEEPITYTLQTREEAIAAAWAASRQTWRDSLRIIESVRLYADPCIPPGGIRRIVPYIPGVWV